LIREGRPDFRTSASKVSGVNSTTATASVAVASCQRRDDNRMIKDVDADWWREFRKKTLQRRLMQAGVNELLS
jgi:hypothetical protein